MPFKDIAKKLSQEIRELADNAGDPITMEWKTGEVIIEKGKTGNYMYLVVSGEAEIRVGGECPGAPDARVQLVSDNGQNNSTDDDDTSLLLIIVAVLAAIVVLGGGAALFVRQRSG